ncbi:MAG: hypothetical protein WA655_20115 [Candidatus Korobacteraceae bacterium]
MADTKPTEPFPAQSLLSERIRRRDVATGTGGVPVDETDPPMGGGGPEDIDAPIWFREMLE